MPPGTNRLQSHWRCSSRGGVASINARHAMPSAWGDTAKNTRNGKASARWPMTFESNGCRRVAERVNKHAGAWWHGLPANVPGGVHVRPAVGRLRLVERKQARVVDHDRNLGHSVVTRIAKVDKSVELAGTKIGVRHRKPRAPAGKMIWDCAGISDAFNAGVHHVR